MTLIALSSERATVVFVLSTTTKATVHMLFLFFGGGTRLKEIGTGAERTCPRCRNTTTWQRLRRFDELTVFLIPVARWIRRELEACPVCGEEHALSAPASHHTATHRRATA